MKNYRVWLIVDITMQVLLILGIVVSFLLRSTGALDLDYFGVGFTTYIILGGWQLGMSLLIYFLSGRTLRKNYVRVVGRFLAIILGVVVFASVTGLGDLILLMMFTMLIIPPFFALWNFIESTTALGRLNKKEAPLPEHTETFLA